MGITTGSSVVATRDLHDRGIPIMQGSPGRVVAISGYFSSIYTVEFTTPDSSNRTVIAHRLCGADLRAI